VQGHAGKSRASATVAAACPKCKLAAPANKPNNRDGDDTTVILLLTMPMVVVKDPYIYIYIDR
jgi:hypothetical protein